MEIVGQKGTRLIHTAKFPSKGMFPFTPAPPVDQESASLLALGGKEVIDTNVLVGLFPTGERLPVVQSCPGSSGPESCHCLSLGPVSWAPPRPDRVGRRHPPSASIHSHEFPPAASLRQQLCGQPAQRLHDGPAAPGQLHQLARVPRHGEEAPPAPGSLSLLSRIQPF